MDALIGAWGLGDYAPPPRWRRVQFVGGHLDGEVLEVDPRREVIEVLVPPAPPTFDRTADIPRDISFRTAVYHRRRWRPHLMAEVEDRMVLDGLKRHVENAGH